MLKPYKLEQKYRVTSAYYKVKVGDVLPLYAMSDVHYDSVKCQRDLLKKDLDYAKKTERQIIIAGDLFDVMQAAGDRRASKDEIRPEYLGQNYIDLVLDDTYEFLKPYSDNLFLIGLGNHETSALKYYNTNLVDRLVDRLRQAGSQVLAGAYGGFIRFMWERGTPKGSTIYYYHHGKGGDAPVSRGITHTNRQAVYVPDADIVHNGHNHQGYVAPIPKIRLNNKGVEITTTQLFLRTPGYKSKSEKERYGYDLERHPGATAVGSISVDIEITSGTPEYRATMLARTF